MRRVFPFTILIALTVPAWAQDTAALPDGYAGGEMCGICHEDTFRDFQQNPHQRLETAERWDWQGRSCEACHGAGEFFDKPADKKHEEAVGKGYTTCTEETCKTCHNDTSPTWDAEKYTTEDGEKVGFDFKQALKKIAHPIPKEEG